MVNSRRCENAVSLKHKNGLTIITQHAKQAATAVEARVTLNGNWSNQSRPFKELQRNIKK